MDLAKIRKKIKETEADAAQPKPGGRPAEEQAAQEIASDERESAGSAGQKSNQTGQNLVSEPITEDAEQATPPTGIEQKPDSESLTETGEPVMTGDAFKHESKEIVREEIHYTEEKKGKKKIEGKVGEGAADEIVEILTFRLLNEEFALKITQLKEILRYQKITKVPRMPDYVIGITSLRGKVIPVVDLRVKISLKDTPSEIDEKGKILIINGPKGLIGAIVDKVIGVVRIAKSDILPPPSHLTEEQLQYIEGIAVIDKRFISIMNMEEVVTIQLP